MKSKMDWPSVKGAFRTSGALMVGNSVVLPLLTAGEHRWWWVVFICGIVMILATSTISKGSS